MDSINGTRRRYVFVTGGLTATLCKGLGPSLGHFTYLNSHFCSKFTLDFGEYDMSRYAGRCPFLCCKLGVIQKPLRPYRAHNVQPFGRDGGEKVPFAYFIFFYSFDVRSIRITIRNIFFWHCIDRQRPVEWIF